MLKLNSSSSITWRKVDYHFWVMKMCMGTWKWHCIEIILTFQSSKDWPLSTEINPTSSPYYLLSDLKVSLQNKQRLMASCYFPYDSIISQRQDKTFPQNSMVLVVSFNNSIQWSGPVLYLNYRLGYHARSRPTSMYIIQDDFCLLQN